MINFLVRVFKEYSHDKGGQMSAAFAYIAVFAIGPLLLVLVSVVGFIFGERAARGQLYTQLSNAFGPDTAKTLQNVIAATHHSGSGAVALVVGVIGLLLAATSLSAQLQNSFNNILGAVRDPASGLKPIIANKLKNLALIGLAAIVALASLVATMVISGAGKSFIWEVLNSGVSLVLFAAVLYLIYRFLPDLDISRRIAWATAVIIGLSFLINKLVLGLIIGHNATASAYGAAASLVVLLLWFYYDAQILFLGVEGIKVYAQMHKLKFPAKRHNLRSHSFQILIKNDLRGRLLDGFMRGYKAKKPN